MKKVFISAMAFLTFAVVNAQDASEGPTSKGKFLIEANTGKPTIGSTSIGFYTSDGNSSYNIGLDGGYFVMDDLAIKGGLGFNGFSGDSYTESAISYRLGAKYYIKSKIPVTLDITGASGKLAENFIGETPLWLGIGAGYAWFVSQNISIEPGLRYNQSLNENYSEKGSFQFNVGFVLHF